jgi:16S rRNA (uracil1498-N3)-methyltransferase
MIRLFTPQKLAKDAVFDADERQRHYLSNVMRQKSGDMVLLFDGHNGEWQAELKAEKNHLSFQLKKQTRPQKEEADIGLVFAPIKRGHGDYMVEKATELGVSRLQPVITQRTIVTRVALDRIQSIAIEAAEQCERLSVPEITSEQKLDGLLQGWDAKRPLLLCAEEGKAEPLAHILRSMHEKAFSLMTGPEGGFAPEEFEKLRGCSFVTPVSLGPRILRADTAVLAALTLAQALKGDWTETRSPLG